MKNNKKNQDVEPSFLAENGVDETDDRIVSSKLEEEHSVVFKEHQDNKNLPDSLDSNDSALSKRKVSSKENFNKIGLILKEEAKNASLVSLEFLRKSWEKCIERFSKILSSIKKPFDNNYAGFLKKFACKENASRLFAERKIVDKAIGKWDSAKNYIKTKVSLYGIRKVLVSSSIIGILVLTTLSFVIFNQAGLFENGSGNNTYTLDGPQFLSVNGLYLGMDISEAEQLIEARFTVDLRESNGGKDKEEFEKHTMDQNKELVMFQNSNVLIGASKSGSVHYIKINGEALKRILYKQDLTSPEIAQKFVDDNGIPEFLVEKINDQYIWVFESPFKYRIEMNQVNNDLKIQSI